MKGWMIGLTVLCCTPFVTLARPAENAGFVQGLWYSDYAPLAAEPVRMYAAVRNNTGADLTGTVEFFVNDERIARKNVTALDGRIVETWADWEPNYGEHAIRAELSRVVLSSSGDTEERSTVTATLAEDTLFVDRDTDNDGIGNKIDADDDGDGIPDLTEQANDTDPLDPDSPPTIDTPSNGSNDQPVTNDTVEMATSTLNNTTAAGLEQYLAPSRANTILTSITDWATARKSTLDAYREEQGRSLTSAPNEPANITVDADGFGEVTRRDTSEDPPRPTGGIDSVIGDLMAMIDTIVSAGITPLLGIISYTLGYPMLLQLGLLLVLLWVVLRIARFFGKRPGK